MLSKSEYPNQRVDAPVVKRLRNYKSCRGALLNYVIYYGPSHSTEVLLISILYAQAICSMKASIVIS